MGLTEAFDVVIDLLQDPDILQPGVAWWCGRGCGMGGRWLGLIRDRWVGKRGLRHGCWREGKRACALEKGRTGRGGFRREIFHLLKWGHFFGRQSMSFVDCELRAIVDTLVYTMVSADFAAGISSCLMREPLRQKHETFLLFAWSHEANLLWLLVRISILYTNISRGFFLLFFLVTKQICSIFNLTELRSMGHFCIYNFKQ